MTSPSNHSNQATATTADLDALADTVHELRPAWHRVSLVTKLREHAAAGVPYAQLRRAAIAAAKEHHYKTPSGIQWELDRLAREASLPGGGAPCATCGKPYETCIVRPRARWDEDADDHDYEPVSTRRARRCGRRPGSNEGQEGATR